MNEFLIINYEYTIKTCFYYLYYHYLFLYINYVFSATEKSESSPLLSPDLTVLLPYDSFVFLNSSSNWWLLLDVVAFYCTCRTPEFLNVGSILVVVRIFLTVLPRDPPPDRSEVLSPPLELIPLKSLEICICKPSKSREISTTSSLSFFSVYTYCLLVVRAEIWF